jgi:hypothetical protein
MTSLILIDTKAGTVRRIVGKTIGPLFKINGSTTLEQLQMSIESLRTGDLKEERDPGEMAFDAISSQLTCARH